MVRLLRWGVLGVCVALVSSPLFGQGRTYTFDPDFDEGALFNVEHDTVHDQLQLESELTVQPFIWVPTLNGTISKVDTETGAELGRYAVAPHTSSSPSRTTVDLDGNCWVGNRQAGTVVKVGLKEAGQGVGWIDRNGNGVCDTSSGTNVLPWGQDECVLLEVVLIPGKEGSYVPGTYAGGYDYGNLSTSPRGLAVDANNNLWAGTWDEPGSDRCEYHYIDGSTGNILKKIDLSNHSAYGAVIDGNGILWSSGWSSNTLVRIDPSDDSVSSQTMGGQYTYGLGVDNLDHLWSSSYSYDKLRKLDVNDTVAPFTITTYNKSEFNQSRGVAVTSDNNVWVANTGTGQVFRYDNNGTWVATINVGSQPTGVAVDAAGKVWCVNLDGGIRRIDPATNSVDLTSWVGGAGHYGYSDMTGIISSTITTQVGTWTVAYDSGLVDAPWGSVSWNSFEPVGTAITVKVQSSTNGSDWSSWETVTNGVALSQTPDGRYLNILAQLQILSGDVSPILYDLTVAVIPAPAAIVLGAIGLGMVGWLKRRRAGHKPE